MRRWLLRFAIGLFGAWALSAAAFALDPVRLEVPVRGMGRGRVHSTFGARRPGGRRHEGVDLFAPRGTAVLAAQDGVVIRIGTSRLGGKVVWTAGRPGALCYYAHLDRIRPDLTVGEMVTAGERLGTVGNTGNARTTRPHLHFEVRPIFTGLMAWDPAPLLR